MKGLFLKSLYQREAMLGYGGGISYWITEHFELLAGMVLSIVMVVSSVFLQYFKIRSIQNEERRKQEEHEMRMQQQTELHNRQMDQG